MEQVSSIEFRQRMAFWLQHLPIEITHHRKVVAIVINPGTSPQAEQPAPATQDTVLNTLKAGMAAIMNKNKAKVDMSTGEILHPKAEVRTFTQPADIDNEEVIFTGTFQDFVKKLGKQKAAQAWARSKPITKE